jgi:hypothetical protein
MPIGSSCRCRRQSRPHDVEAYYAARAKRVFRNSPVRLPRGLVGIRMQRCRQWAYKVGGLQAAAQLKEDFATEWERAGRKMNPDALEIAAECRREANILRSYGGNPSRRPI